jgi:hypothetical protein
VIQQLSWYVTTIASSGLHWYVITAYRYSGLGAVDDLSIATAEAYSASSQLWICWGRGQGEAERVAGAASEGAARQ